MTTAKATVPHSAKKGGDQSDGDVMPIPVKNERVKQLLQDRSGLSKEPRFDAFDKDRWRSNSSAATPRKSERGTAVATSIRDYSGRLDMVSPVHGPMTAHLEENTCCTFSRQILILLTGDI